MENRSRNTALVFIAAGLFLLLGNLFGFFTVVAIFVIWLGVYKIRLGEEKTGYVLFAIGILFLASGHFSLVLAVILISLGYFIVRSKQLHKDENYVQKQSLLESIRFNKEPWELKSSSIWSIIGEINLDLSLAMTNEQETTLVFQGIIGDIDILVPDDLGVMIHSTIVLGQSNVGADREAGMMNKLVWRSPHYDAAEQKVNITISYIIGDLDIKVL